MLWLIRMPLHLRSNPPQRRSEYAPECNYESRKPRPRQKRNRAGAAWDRVDCDLSRRHASLAVCAAYGAAAHREEQHPLLVRRDESAEPLQQAWKSAGWHGSCADDGCATDPVVYC